MIVDDAMESCCDGVGGEGMGKVRKFFEVSAKVSQKVVVEIIYNFSYCENVDLQIPTNISHKKS